MAAKDFSQRRQPLKYSGDRDQGRQRNNNEDLIGIDPENNVFVVIDGVGGNAAGEVAAGIAREQLMARLKDPSDTIERRMREAIAVANKEIYERAQEDAGLQGMACVLTAAVIEGDQITIGHVGDTRLYIIHHGEIRKVTHDHSPVGEMEDRKEISELEAMQHPRRNEIFRDVGSEYHDPDEEGFVEIIHESFKSDSAVLLCSDGLTDMVTSDQILDVINRRAGDPDAVVRELIAAANEAGGKDNISVVYVEGSHFDSSPRHTPTAQTKPRSAPYAIQQTPRLRRSGYVEQGAAWPQPDEGRALSFISALLWSRWAIFIYGALTGITLFYLMQDYLRISPSTDNNPSFEQKTVLRVNAADPSAYATISQAMEKARAGDTIEVAAGRYAEQVIMRKEITLISKRPREAVIISSGQGSELRAAVAIEGVKSGKFAGFRIEADQRAALITGLRVANSSVDVTDVEVIGAQDAGVEIEGGTSILRECYIHDNPGAGVVIKGEGLSRLVNNRITGNGKKLGKKRAGIEILNEAARFENFSNIIEGNGIDAIPRSGRNEVDTRSSSPARNRSRR